MSRMKPSEVKQLIEAAIFAADSPLSIKQIKEKLLFDNTISQKAIKATIDELAHDYTDRGIELVKLSQGYRFQTKTSLSERLTALYNDRAAKISPAAIETLSIIAYKQPVTRSEIEEIRGVAVSSQIIKTLTERQWVKIVGHKEVPGRPALLGTTPAFLNYFSLKSIAQLPQIMPLAESQSLQDSSKQRETEA